MQISISFSQFTRFLFWEKKTLIKICTFFFAGANVSSDNRWIMSSFMSFFCHTFWCRQNTYAENRKIAWFIGGNWLIKEVRPEHQKYVAWQRNSLTCLHFIWIGGYISGHCIDHTNGFAHIFCHCDFPLVFLFCCSFFLFGRLCGKKQRRNNNFLLPQVNEFLNFAGCFALFRSVTAFQLNFPSISDWFKTFYMFHHTLDTMPSIAISI